MAVKKNSIIIAGGGTGGHISPGIALYEEFKSQGQRAIFLVGNNDSRFSSLDTISSSDLHFYGAPNATKNIFKLPFFVIKFLIAVIKTIKFINSDNVCAVIGMGGYVSAPALMAAKIKKIPIFLCEQNTVPGKVTITFEKYAEQIYSTFNTASQYLKFKEKFNHCGNPTRKKIFTELTKEEAKKQFHLGHCKKVILVIGGSQGALSINNLVLDIKKRYPENFKETGIIWSTGDYSYQKFKDAIHNEINAGSIFISPYINDVGAAYKAADIALSRSGAGVMMELAAMGIPSIYIPFPFAASDHQNKNADEFASENAAIKINSDDATPENVSAVIFDLLNNSRKSSEMSKRAVEVSKRDAAEVIVKDILKNINVGEQ